VRWTGLWRRKAANESTATATGDLFCFCAANPPPSAIVGHRAGREQQHPRSSSSNTIDHAQRINGPSNKSLGVVWMDMYPDGGLPLPPTSRSMMPPAFTVHPRPLRQSSALTKRHSPISCVRKPRERLRSRRRANEGKFTTDRNPYSVFSALIFPCRCLFPGFVACLIVIGNARNAHACWERLGRPRLLSFRVVAIAR
jgi:hypothetical protein